MAVTLSFGSNQGFLNSTTPVQIVPAPSAGVTRAIRYMSFVNLDTADVTIHAVKLVVTTDYEFDSSGLLAPGRVFQPVAWAGCIFLTGVTQSINAFLAGAVATNQPSFVVSWIDRTVA